MKKLLMLMMLTMISFAPAHASGVMEDVKRGFQSFKSDYKAACSDHYLVATEDLANVVANYMGHYINPTEFRILVGALRAQHVAVEGTCVFSGPKARSYRRQKNTYIDFHRDVVRAYQDGRGDIYYGTLLAKYGFRSLLNLF